MADPSSARLATSYRSILLSRYGESAKINKNVSGSNSTTLDYGVAYIIMYQYLTSSIMGAFRHSFRALMQRNSIYRKRRWIGLASVSDTNRFRQEVVEPSFPAQTIIPLSFADYVKALYVEHVVGFQTRAGGPELLDSRT
eukprot:scaffold10756_cov62-Attheya_sp.AAC.4